MDRRAFMNFVGPRDNTIGSPQWQPSWPSVESP